VRFPALGEPLKIHSHLNDISAKRSQTVLNLQTVFLQLFTPAIRKPIKIYSPFE